MKMPEWSEPFAVLGVPRPLPVLGSNFAPAPVELDALLCVPSENRLVGVVRPRLSEADQADAGLFEAVVVDGVEDAPSVNVLLGIVCEFAWDHVREGYVGVCNNQSA